MTHQFDKSRWSRNDDSAVENAIRSGATRRDLLRMLAAGGVVAATAGTFIGSARNAVAQTPKKGGALRLALNSTSTADTLDPVRASAQGDYMRMSTFYNKLTVLDNSLTPQMELAESFDTTDAKVWTIKLKTGITFHNGKTMDSADVVYSLSRHVDPKLTSRANALAKAMIKIEAVDKTTVRIELDQANADLPAILGTYHFVIIPEGTSDFTKAVGTGPYMTEVFEPGIRTVGKRNPNYFKSDAAYVDSIEMFGIPDENARVNALLSGDIHIGASMDARSAPLVKANPNLRLMVAPGGSYTNLNIRMDMEPGSKKDFIDGVRALINRDAINRAVLRGFGEPHNDQPIQRASRYFNADVVAPAFDPERAKHHFEKAGLLGVGIPLICSEAAKASPDMAMVLQQDAAKIGVKIDVQRMPADGYWSNQWIKAPFHFGNINARPTADILFSLLYKSDAAWNESRYVNPKFDQMLLEARGSLDEAKRKQIYGEMQAMVAKDAATIIPAYIASADAMSTKVGGLNPHPLGMLQGYNIADTVWLDA
jgi:peptide/nickel transport system substrate-binding protein